MRKVIVNSTPIIAFCKARQLSILESMYGEIVIPEVMPVVEEMEKKGIYFSKELKSRVRRIARE